MQIQHTEKPTGTQSPGEIARAFLEVLDPTGTHFLSAFHPQTGLDHSQTFGPGALGDVVEWVNFRAGRFNLYHSVNEVRADFAGKKTAKTDIARIRAVFTDIDPAGGDLNAARAAILDRLRNAPAFCKSLIVDSGGGFHGYSILGEKLAVTEDTQDWVEAQGRALAQVLGGDATQNIDRILRLPGPDNIPTPGKAAKGRVKRQVAVIDDSGDRFTRAQLEAAAPPIFWACATDKSPQIAAAMEDLRHCNYDRDGTTEGLPSELRTKFDRDVADRPDLARLWRDGVRDGDKSGSGHRMALAGALHRAEGYTHEDYAHIAGAWPLAAKPGDDREEKLCERELARCWIKTQPSTPEDWFDELPDDATTDDGWPEPLDIFGTDIPSNLSDPPPGSLPATLAAWAKDESRRKGVSLAFAAAAALGVIAGAVGNTLRVRPRLFDLGWEEPACLWITLVDSPGRGKSPILNAALAPAAELDSGWAREAAPKLAAWEAEKRKAKRADILPPPPVVRRLILDDVTSEKRVSLLKDNPRGLIQAPDELAQLLGGLGQYKASGNADRAMLLKLNSGGVVTVDRVGGGTLRAERALLSILAGTQPDKIEKIAADLGSDGLLQRFIFVCGDQLERSGGQDTPPDANAGREYRNLIRDLATSGEVNSPAVRLSPGASDALNHTAAKIRALRNLPGASPAWQGHVEKWGGFLPRIMLTFHAIEQWEVFGAVDAAQPIDASTARKACEFARFLVRHSLAFYQKNFSQTDAATNAVWMAGHILAHPTKSAFTRRDISDARKTLRNGDRALLSMMEELENCGWVRVLQRGGDGPTKWTVNPVVHERFQDRAAYERKERQRMQLAIKSGAAVRKNWLEQDAMSESEAQ